MQRKLDSPRNQLDTYYSRIFGLYDIIALQEISPKTRVGQPGKDFGRQWKVSDVLSKERLAFAYDAGKFNSPDCNVLQVPVRVNSKGKTKEERSIYWCKFQVKQVCLLLIDYITFSLKPTFLESEDNHTGKCPYSQSGTDQYWHKI